jgi:hypothetical protein
VVPREVSEVELATYTVHMELRPRPAMSVAGKRELTERAAWHS